MNLRDLFLRLRAMVAPHRVERELDEELAFHIERDMQRHIANGLSQEDAHARARARFGSVALAAEQCRDARRTALVDDLVQDILYAFRTFRRSPLAALTIVATVALGLGFVAVAFTIYNFFLLRVDAVRSPRELFAVELQQVSQRIGQESESNIVLTRPDYEAMRRDTEVFTETFAMSDPGVKRFEDRPSRPSLVTGNFFQVLGVQATLGRTLLPGDDESGGRLAVVLSHAGWRKFFASDPGVIGRRVVIQGLSCEIVGVMPESFRGLGVTPPDYWAPLASAEDTIAIEIIGRLESRRSPAAAAATLSAWASRRADLQKSSGRPMQVSLVPRQGSLSGDALTWNLTFFPLFFAFGLILAIGCANVANLLLARDVSRQREIGIRLSLGASRRRIIRQLLTESLILALAAAACGLAISRLLLGGLLYALTNTMPPDIAVFVSLMNLAVPSLDWHVLAFLVAGAIVSTMLFGLTPALHATRLDLVSTMRGEVMRGARPRRARHALIGVQVGASALLLICAAIFLRGAWAAATKDQRIRTSDTVRVTLGTGSQRAALDALMTDPLVVAIAASSRLTPGLVATSLREGRANTLSSVPVRQLAVSPEYFDVLGISVVSGRAFTAVERTAEAGVVIVSETVARQLWPDGNGVGQLLRLDAPQSSSPDARSFSSTEARSAQVEPSRTLTVVGVARDPGLTTGDYLETFRGVYLPTSPEEPGAWWLYLRVRGNPEQARRVLLERLMRADPVGLPNIIVMGGSQQAFFLRIAFWATFMLSGLALVLTASGLFSVLSHVVEQQAKEIGVRMALGATTRNVAGLVLSQSLRPVGIGLVTGGGLAAIVAIVLTAIPGSEVGGWVDVFDPVAYATCVPVIVTSSVLAVLVPALRAARIDPIETLRRD